MYGYNGQIRSGGGRGGGEGWSAGGGGGGGDGEEGGSSTSSGLWLLQRKTWKRTELSPVLVHRAAAARRRCLERAEAAPALRHSHRSDSGMDEGEINSSRHLQLTSEPGEEEEEEGEGEGEGFNQRGRKSGPEGSTEEGEEGVRESE